MNSSILILCLVLTPACEDGARPSEVRLTVVGIVGTERNDEVDPRLKGIVKAVQEKEPKLIGFRVERISKESVKVGDSAEFSVCKQGKLTLHVAVNKSADGRICITVNPPKHKGSVKYSCSCGKYVPILTRCVTPDGDRLIIAVMATPCRANK